MSLSSGTQLGPYQIVAPLGAGGMGEVYRARDTRLGRDVAIKVLPSHLSSNPDLKARFEREARSIASLNHPHICHLYDIGSRDGSDYLVMELLEGETLAQRLEKGALPLPQALQCGIEIAQALEKAHKNGIVHRDLKPGNIMLTKGGAKLLDFGLAKPTKSMATIVGSGATMSTPLTGEGAMVGTFQYMAPEQIHGENADARTDIFAFGAVLYEMVTGERAFPGKNQISVMSAILEKEPEPISALQRLAPAALDRVAKTCLAKEAEERFQAAHDLKLQLEWIRDAGPGTPAAAHGRLGHRAMWTLAAVAAILAATTVYFAGTYPRRRNAPEQPIVSQIPSPAGENFAFAGEAAGPPALSPDGQRLAFVAAGADGKQRLWVQQLKAPTPQPLPGTDGSTHPFWSADSRYIGFFANNKLNWIDASGGPPLAIADVTIARGGTWSGDGTILFSPDPFSPIYRVPVSGGVPQPVTKLNASRGEITHRWPQFLPDGKHFLFYAHGNDPQNNATYAATLDGGEPKLLVHGDTNAVYASPGYLLFVRQGTLMAQQFDAGSMSLTGDAAPLAEHAAINSFVWRGLFTVSENGILTYAAGGSAGSRILWFDRSGKQTAETGAPGEYYDPRISPDGHKLAVIIVAPATSDLSIWIFDLGRGVPTRLTFSSALNINPTWSPDGKTIAFASNQGGQFHIYQTAADGSGNTSPLFEDDANDRVPLFSSDGRYLIFTHQPAQSGAHREIWAMPLFGGRKMFGVVQNLQYDSVQPALSPDGKWLAYSSPESGRPEIYVVPFGQGRGKWQVSTGGGTWPRWRHDGQEIFYLSPDRKIMSVEISAAGSSLVAGKVTPRFQVNLAYSFNRWPYDVSADGDRFVVVNPDSRQAGEPLTLVVNWPALLKKQ